MNFNIKIGVIETPFPQVNPMEQMMGVRRSCTLPELPQKVSAQKLNSFGLTAPVYPARRGG